MTVPGKGGRPRKWASDTDRVRAYRARQRGDDEPPTIAEAADGDDAVAAALRRERELEDLLAAARSQIAAFRRDLIATEQSVERLEDRIGVLERERAHFMQQATDLRERLQRAEADALRRPRPAPLAGPNRAARRRATRDRHD